MKMVVSLMELPKRIRAIPALRDMEGITVAMVQAALVFWAIALHPRLTVVIVRLMPLLTEL